MTPDEVKSPIRLNRGEWIVAIFCENVPGAEDSPDALEVSRLRTAIADADRTVFEEWVQVLIKWQERLTQSVTGLEVTRSEIIRKLKPESN